MTAPRDMASTMEAKKDALQQKQDGMWKFTVTVHPDDMPTWLMKAAMGTRLQCAIVEIGDDEQPLPQEKRTWGEYSRAERSGILCGDTNFITWLSNKYIKDFPLKYNNLGEREEGWEDWSARLVRGLCQVVSRAELNTSSAAGRAWDALEAEYRQATGQRTEQRG